MSARNQYGGALLLIVLCSASVSLGQRLRIRDPSSHLAVGSQYSGLVEVFFNNEWGTVCRNNWSFNDATVVCRTAGFTSVVRSVLYGHDRFGGVNSTVWLDNVRCNGSERSFFDCPNNGVGNVSLNCANHDGDVGVVCTDTGAVRLIGGSNSSEGRVEIYNSGQWGTICDDGWNINDAIVVCKELGFPTALSSFSNAYFGSGTGVIWMDNVRCTGLESHLSSCTFNGWGIHNCGHYEDAGVRCMERSYLSQFLPVRLVNGLRNSNNTDNLTTGNVEVFYHGAWGTVCDDLWTIEDAQVVCLQLGFTGADLATSRGAYGYGPSTQAIVLDQVTCTGNEPSLNQCEHNLLTVHDCSHYEDAGVSCDGHDPAANFSVRLVNFSNSSNDQIVEGRVEVFYNGVWGTICDDLWDLRDAEVVCRTLGFNIALRAGTVPYSFRGSGVIWIDNLQCDGNETSLEYCSFPGWGIHDCSHYEDATVACFNHTELGAPVRLVGGSSPAEGRLQVMINGVWGGVCSLNWTQVSSEVVCNQLGFYGNASTSSFGQFGGGYLFYYEDEPFGVFVCNGTESYLSDCDSRFWGFGSLDFQHYTSFLCEYVYDAVGVVCEGADFAIPVRLSNGTAPSNGRVEIYADGRWGTVCDYSWDLNDATVVCHQLGFAGAQQALRGSFYGSGNDQGISFITSSIYCQGTETQLANCSGISTTPSSISSYCRSSRTAGIRCLGGVEPMPPIRLVGGVNRYEGRVEVLIQGQWGTVCDDLWNDNDAKVVCRQLGFSPTGALAYSYAHFGRGVGPITLDNVQCTGLESYLTDCSHNGLYIHNCGHGEDAGVRCQERGTTNFSHPVRLILNGVHSPSLSEGTVEILYAGAWGSVCDDYWGYSAAQVVCRMLGFHGATRAWSRAHFGVSPGRIVLDNVRCEGSERELSECQHLAFNTHNCGHSEDAGVSCLTNQQPSSYPVRLVSGNGRSRGRVEIMYNGTWGTVCDDSWDRFDGNVVCHQLGYAGAIRVTVRAEYGRGTGPIWMDNVHCSGQEEHLDACQHNGFGVHDCSHSEDAGVACYGEFLPVRLVNGSNSHEGRVEIFLNGVWGTICDSFWDSLDAQVVCTQLGFNPVGVEALRGSFFGVGTGPIYYSVIGCDGTELSLFNCSNSNLTISTCTHRHDAGVRCPNASVVVPNIQIRLVGGRSSSEGRVEVTTNGTWGTVCDDSWDINDANVVCRQLGFDRATAALSNAYFGPGAASMSIYLDDVGCFGNEASLSECPASLWGIHNCLHLEDAGVRCHSQENERVRLIGGDSSSSGRLEIFHNGVWGSVCGIGWSFLNSQVVCRELGYARALSGSTYTLGTGRVWLSDVNCAGTEDSLYECQRSSWAGSRCLSYMYVEVRCSAIPNNPYPVRLIGGQHLYEGRVEIYYNNEWGTICDDLWTLTNAEVVCRELGFPGAQFALTSQSRFGSGSGGIWLDDVSCNGTEYFIHQCDHRTFGQNDCSHSEDAAVICNPSILKIRLGGDNRSSSLVGRVEVNYNGQGWGTVCDDYWSLSDATVACRMLGYGSALSATTHGNPFGEGIGHIWLDDIVCFGNETSLLLCSHSNLGVHDCLHSEDAGVVCSAQAVCSLFSMANGHFMDTANNTASITQGTMVRVQCNPGYAPFGGNVNYSCDSTGTWQPHTPGCDHRCTPLTLPNNLMSSSLSTYPGTRVNFTCTNPLVLHGPPAIVCLSGGHWSSSVPSCSQRVCPYIFPPAHLSANRVGSSIGTNVTFQCDSGYHLVGARNVTCLTTGNWSAPTPTCQLGDVCPAISSSHGQFLIQHNSTSALTVGTMITTVRCDPGYAAINGSSLATCSAGGHWAPSTPGCGHSCLVLDTRRHQHRSTMATYPGVQVSFSCDTNYSINGSSRISCSLDGTWSGSQPFCRQVSCPMLTWSDVHLLPNHLGVSVGSVITFHCEDGWHMNGPLSITCLPSGSWSGSSPTCQSGGTCPRFDMSHGIFNFQYNTSQELIFGTRVTMQCDFGYGTNLGTPFSTCLTSQRWHPMTPGCDLMCPSISSSGATPNTTSNYPGTTVGFSCGMGNIMHGAATIVCQAGGSWSSPPPVCSQALCPTLSISRHLYATNTERTPGAIVLFKCEQGWHVVGSPTVICQIDGTWSNTEPTCAEGGSCPSFDISHGDFSFQFNTSQELVVNTMVTMNCDKGYSPILGLNQTSCARNLSWVPVTPGCSLLCPNLILTSNVRTATLDSFPTKVVDFRCVRDDMIMHGAASITCLDGGRWSAEPPVCVEAGCSSPTISANLVALSDGHSINNRISFRCEKGWHLNGSVTITCLPNSTWSDPEPTCLPGDACPIMNSTLAHGAITYSGNSSNALLEKTKMNIRCNQGMNPVRGINSSSCSSEGVWLPIALSCDKSCSVFELNNDLSISINTTNTFPGVAVNFTCKHGSVLQGQFEITCMSGGKWSAESPSCISVAVPPSPNALVAQGQLGGLVGGVVAVALVVILLTLCSTFLIWKAVVHFRKPARGREISIRAEFPLDNEELFNEEESDNLEPSPSCDDERARLVFTDDDNPAT